MTESDGITGKVVAVTGAGRGIGAATGRLLAARGARLVLGSRAEQELAGVADAITVNGGQVCEVMRQELAPEGIRSTLVSPGFTDTDFIANTREPAELAALTARRDATAMPPAAVVETIAFAIAQPDSVDIGEILVRPTVQP
jgi:NADP-dependent 3-hydroxy acid dehydrogenase YdfG